MPLISFTAVRELLRRPRRTSSRALTFTLGLCIASQAFAQSAVDGVLRGRITHSSTAPASTQVQLRRSDSSWHQTISPARDGSFTVLALPSGDYILAAEHCAQPVSISAGEITEATIDPAACAQRRPDPLPLATLDATDLSELNSSAHDATLAAAPPDETTSDELATPEATRETTQLGSGGPSVSGLSPTANSTLLDGLSTLQNFRSGPRGSAAGGPRTSATFSQSATRSLRLQPQSFSAQYGGAGGVISITTRGQAERLHGSAFLLSRQSALAATNPFSVVTHYNNGAVTSQLTKPSDSLLQLGAAAGLPLSRAPFAWMHHASVFASLEAQLRSGQIVSTPATASFYALTPEQLALLANRGVSASATNTALNFLDSLSGPLHRDSSRILSFARLDLVPTIKQQLTLGYIGNRFNSPTGSNSGVSEGVIARGRASLATSTLHVDAVTGRWLYRVSSLASNELRGQFARDLEYETPHTPLPQEPAISAGGFAPQVSIAPNGFSYGTPSSIGRTAYPDERRLQLADTFTAARGRHLFTVGADWSRITDRIAGDTNAAGTFLYDSGTTNGRDGGLVDWITDYTFNVHAYPNGACPSINAANHLFCFRSYTQNFSAASSQFVTHDIAAFAEDTLRLPHALSLTLGARYDYTLLPLPQNPNPALDQALSTFKSPVTGTTAVIPEDRNNVGPRVSLAWSPAHARLITVRLAYGVFYGRLAGATVNAALTDTARSNTTRRIRITPSTITACPQVANQGFGYPCAYTAAPPSAVAQTTSALVFSNRFRLPAVQRAGISLERSTRSLELRAGYAMAVATQLSQTVDLNIAPSATTARFIIQGGDGHRGLYSGETFTVPLYTARRATAFGPISALVSNANASYHSFNAEARLHLHSLQLRGSYTFARAIDYGPQLSATPRQNGQFDPFTSSYDKALSSLDIRHRFTGDLVLRSSVHNGPERLRHALSGWQLATIAAVGSGAPYSYAIFGGTALSGGRESINGSGGASYLPTVGRNTLRLPMRSRVDLRAGRAFALHEHVRLNTFAEAFNLLNTQSFSRIETRAFLLGNQSFSGAPTPLIFQDAATVAAEGITTPAFGTPTSSIAGVSRERQFQLGLRLEF